MTCGIYILNFTGTDKVYIGKSKKIEARYTRHLESFRAGIASKKMMEAYRVYGTPTYTVLCETSLEDLDKTEYEAIQIYNAVENGFNSLDGIRKNAQMCGESASNSLYDNDTYVEILKYLALNTYTNKRISEILGVSTSVVGSISKLENHAWLEKYLPTEFAIVKNLKESFIPGSQRNAETLGIVYPEVVSPTGQVYNIINLRKFAEEHNLASSNLHSLLIGKLTTLHGWKLKHTILKTYPKLVHVDGRIESIPYLGARKFAMANGLNPPNLSQLLNGKLEEYKGWKILNEENI